MAQESHETDVAQLELKLATASDGKNSDAYAPETLGFDPGAT
jgi:hypothetical protein